MQAPAPPLELGESDQHEARGADQIITSAIDAHVQGQRQKGDDVQDGAAGILPPAG